MGPYLVMTKLSDANYKIQNTTDPSRSMIVHFDRLKLCAPGTSYQVPSSPDIIPSTGPTRHVGDDTELFCDDEDDPPVPNALVPSSAPPHYPRCTHRPPDWLMLTVRY